MTRTSERWTKNKQGALFKGAPLEEREIKSIIEVCRLFMRFVSVTARDNLLKLPSFVKRNGILGICTHPQCGICRALSMDRWGSAGCQRAIQVHLRCLEGGVLPPGVGCGQVEVFHTWGGFGPLRGGQIGSAIGLSALAQALNRCFPFVFRK